IAEDLLPPRTPLGILVLAASERRARRRNGRWSTLLRFRRPVAGRGLRSCTLGCPRRRRARALHLTRPARARRQRRWLAAVEFGFLGSTGGQHLGAHRRRLWGCGSVEPSAVGRWFRNACPGRVFGVSEGRRWRSGHRRQRRLFRHWRRQPDVVERFGLRGHTWDRPPFGTQRRRARRDGCILARWLVHRFGRGG